MMFSCKNLALNMAKSLSFLFFYSTFQYLVKYINGYYGKDDRYKNFDLSFCYVFKFYDCTKFHYSQVIGEKKLSTTKILKSFFFDHLHTDEALSSTECPFTCISAMLERTHHYLL